MKIRATPAGVYVDGIPIEKARDLAQRYSGEDQAFRRELIELTMETKLDDVDEKLKDGVEL